MRHWYCETVSGIGIGVLAKHTKLRRLSLFYKIYNDQSPLYLYNLILAKKPGNYPLRNVKEISTIKVKHSFFGNSFLPATITEWDDLDHLLRSAPSINVFKQNVLKFIRFGPNKVFNIYNSHGLKLLTRPRLGFDKTCMCGKDIKSTNHFLLQFSLFLNERQVLMNKIRNIDDSLTDKNENSLLYSSFW